MDICTYDEIPKPEVKGYSNWLSIPEIFNNHLDNVEPFVDCYILWYGTAGRCHNCFAISLCRKLNEE